MEQGLRRWLPTYVKKVGQVRGKKLTPIQSLSVVSTYAKFPELKMPAIIIESGGLVNGSVEEDGDGLLTADFTVSAFLMVQGADAVATRDLLMGYWWPIVASLMQHRRLTDEVSVKRFVDSGFAGANVEQRRTRLASEHVFEVTLENFLNIGEGPVEPDPDPTQGGWPEVQAVETTVEKEQ